MATGLSKESTSNQDFLRRLPAKNRILGSDWLIPYTQKISTHRIQVLIDEALEEVRREIRKQNTWLDPQKKIMATLDAELAKGLQRVINVTGIPLHTNLGRAPLGDAVLQAILEVTKGYSNLEYDLLEGQRGSRHTHVEEPLRAITGASGAMVVNNNAAAVYLMLVALAKGKEVIISRGELVEIGGSFRIPDVMQQSGAILHEVGSTNKTHLADYEAAINENTAMILKVHQSNFRMRGFTSAPPLESLRTLAQKHQILLGVDLGSGVMIDLTKYGVLDEPTVPYYIDAGMDIVTFSGDKLLGGPQAGLVVGREDLIAKLKKHPMARALRVDKMTLAGLHATLSLYLDGKAMQEIPLLAMLSQSQEVLRARCEHLATQLQGVGEVTVRSVSSFVGGGSAPDQGLPSYVVAISLHEHLDAFARCLRQRRPAVVGVISHNAYHMDPRTLFPEQEEELIRAVLSCAKDSGYANF